MPIVVDFGNSRIKVGLFRNDSMRPFAVDFYDYDGGMQDFQDFVTGQNPKEKVIYVSVNDDHQGISYLEQHFQDLVCFNRQMSLPFTSAYATPATLGLDRLAACAGAKVLSNQLPLLVVDAGTCVTYDYINEVNTHLGGAISPGIKMRLASMTKGSDKLPDIKFDAETTVPTIGHSTRECMLVGAVEGLVQEIKGFTATFAKKSSLTVIITGGDGQYLADKLENSTFAAPNIVLIGLHKIRSLNAD